MDGRTIRSRTERETLVFMIFVCLFSKCSFIPGFEVNIKSRLLHTDIQFFDPWYNPELPTTGTKAHVPKQIGRKLQLPGTFQ